MNPQAAIAIRCAKNWSSWGRYAAVRHAQKNGVPRRLVELARVLERIKNDRRRHNEFGPLCAYDLMAGPLEF